MSLTFGNLNLQDKVIITETVQFRSMANRIATLAEVSRRPGSKFLSEEYDKKVITMNGRVLSPSASGMIGILDDIHKNLAISEQQLTITDGRSYTATCTKASFPEQHYNQTIIPFSLEFISASPFSTGSALSPGFGLGATVLEKAVDTTISGSAFAEPTIRLSTAGVGDPGFGQITVAHNTTGEEVTFSGQFSLGLEAVFDYENATVTYSGALQDYTGSFSRWDVGSNEFTVTLSGTNPAGVVGVLEYSPRYFL